MNNSKAFKITKNVIKYAILALVLYQLVFDLICTKFLPTVKNLAPNEALNQLVMGIIDFKTNAQEIFKGWNQFVVGIMNFKFDLSGISSLINWGLGLIILLTLITILFRKAFCKNICPFGSLQDLFGKLGDWFFLKVLKVDHTPKMPKFLHELLSCLKYVVFMVYVLIAIVSGISLLHFVFEGIAISSSSTAANLRQPFLAIDPWLAVEKLSEWKTLTTSYYFVFGALIFSLVGSFMFKRFYCKYVCPTGAYVNIVSVFSFLRKKKETKPVEIQEQQVEAIDEPLQEVVADSEEATEATVEALPEEITDEATEKFTEGAAEEVEAAEIVGDAEASIEVSCTPDACAHCSCNCSHANREPDEFDDEDEYLFGKKVNPIIPLVLSVVIFFIGVVGLQLKDVNAVEMKKSNYMDFVCSDTSTVAELIDAYEEDYTKEELLAAMKLPADIKVKSDGIDLAKCYEAMSMNDVMEVLDWIEYEIIRSYNLPEEVDLTQYIGWNADLIIQDLKLPEGFDMNKTVKEATQNSPVFAVINLYCLLVPGAYDYESLNQMYSLDEVLDRNTALVDAEKIMTKQMIKIEKNSLREELLHHDLDESSHHH